MARYRSIRCYRVHEYHLLEQFLWTRADRRCHDTSPSRTGTAPRATSRSCAYKCPNSQVAEIRTARARTLCRRFCLEIENLFKCDTLYSRNIACWMTYYSLYVITFEYLKKYHVTILKNYFLIYKVHQHFSYFHQTTFLQAYNISPPIISHLPITDEAKFPERKLKSHHRTFPSKSQKLKVTPMDSRRIRIYIHAAKGVAHTRS